MIAISILMQDEELIKVLALRQASRWRLRRCLVCKPVHAVDILQSLFILQNRKQLSKEEVFFFLLIAVDLFIFYFSGVFYFMRKLLFP